MKLYEISREYEEILQDLYDDEGNVNNQALTLLEENKTAMEAKAIAIASYIKNMDAERSAIDKAKKDMANREKRYKKEIEGLQGYLLTALQRRGIQSVKCPYFEIKVKKCPISVDDDTLDMNLLPDEYKRFKTEVSPDKIKIKDEMMAGVVVPGASLKQNLSLVIR